MPSSYQDVIRERLLSGKKLRFQTDKSYLNIKQHKTHLAKSLCYLISHSLYVCAYIPSIECQFSNKGLPVSNKKHFRVGDNISANQEKVAIYELIFFVFQFCLLIYLSHLLQFHLFNLQPDCVLYPDWIKLVSQFLKMHFLFNKKLERHGDSCYCIKQNGCGFLTNILTKEKNLHYLFKDAVSYIILT